MTQCFIPSKDPKEVSMMVRRLAIGVIAAAASGLPIGARARSVYDGNWSVAVYGQSGSCQGGSYQFPVQIVNGNIHHVGGDASVSGRVSSSGAVAVRIATSERSAIGAGRLSRSYGSGTFRGRSSAGLCSGTWTGQRTNP
jgi:hypothetical protein